MFRKILNLALFTLLVACENTPKDITPLDQFPDYILQGMDNSVVNHLEELSLSINEAEGKSRQDQFTDWQKFANACHTYELFEAAELAYLNALKYEINEQVVNYQLGHLYRLQARYELSNEQFRKVEKQNNTYAPVYNNLAENYFDQGNMQAAKEAILSSLNIIENEPYALKIYADILSQSGQVEPAIDALNKVLKIQPQATKIYFSLSQLLYQTGQVDEASEIRKKAGDGTIETTDLWLSEVTEDARGYNRFITHAYSVMNKGDYKTAQYWIEKAESDRPNGFTVNMFKGLINVRLKDNKAALFNFRKAYKIRPDDFKVNLNLGTVYQLSGDIKKSVKYFKRALEIDPNHTAGRMNYAIVNCSAGNLKETLDSVKSLLDSDYKGQALSLGLKCQVQHKRYRGARLWVDENINQVNKNTLFTEFAALLLAASPIDDDRDGKLALAWIEKLIENVGTNNQKQLRVIALMENKQFTLAQQVLNSIKNANNLYVNNQYLKQLIAAQEPYRLRTY